MGRLNSTFQQSRLRSLARSRVVPPGGAAASLPVASLQPGRQVTLCARHDDCRPGPGSKRISGSEQGSLPSGEALASARQSEPPGQLVELSRRLLIPRRLLQPASTTCSGEVICPEVHTPCLILSGLVLSLLLYCPHADLGLPSSPRPDRCAFDTSGAAQVQVHPSFP